jgi:glycosyltransferase involved in cell wall biosynthesis
MPKVTVLVAVYNAETWLARSLNSLLAQTLPDIQVVCVDDASTDGSLQLLRQYAAKDSRIEVIALSENHGQAYARNQGLKRAQGDYVCFLDADDWFSPDALAMAVDVFQKHGQTDSVLFQVDMIYPDRVQRYAMPDADVLTGHEAFLKSIDWQLHGIYMVRTAIHQRFPYDDSCRWFSDDNTTRLHYLASREVRPCDGVYHYFQHPESTSYAVSVHRFDRLRAGESMKEQLLSAGVSHEVMCEWEAQRMLVLVECYRFYREEGRSLTAAERRQGLQEMHRVWGTINRTMLRSPLVHKFGYRLMPSWPLFRCQEWLYFTLRRLLGKNK